jgi:hypothetical protein
MHNHPLICRGCGEYAQLTGGCACPDDEPQSELDAEIADLQRLLDAGEITTRQFLNLRDAAMYAASEA